MEVTDVSTDECNHIKRDREQNIEATIVLKKSGQTLSCELLNYYENCGLDYFDIDVDVVKVRQDSVLVDIKPVIPASKDCSCPFNASFTINGVASNRFYLKCWWYEGDVSFKDDDTLILRYGNK